MVTPEEEIRAGGRLASEMITRLLDGEQIDAHAMCVGRSTNEMIGCISMFAGTFTGVLPFLPDFRDAWPEIAVGTELEMERWSRERHGKP